MIYCLCPKIHQKLEMRLMSFSLIDNSFILNTSTCFLNFADMYFKLLEPVISPSRCRSLLHYAVTISLKCCHLPGREINVISILLNSSTNQNLLKFSLHFFLFPSEIPFDNHFFLWRGLEDFPFTLVRVRGFYLFIVPHFHLCMSSYWSRSEAEACHQIGFMNTQELSPFSILSFHLSCPLFFSCPILALTL